MIPLPAMKKTVVAILLPLALFVFPGCSTDAPSSESPVPVVAFTAFANTGEEIVQLDMRTDEDQPVLVSVSGEFNLQFLQDARNQIDTASIAYYTWDNRQSRVYYKDLETGDVFAESDICGFSGETGNDQSIRTVWGNRDYVVAAYSRFPAGSPEEARLRIFNRNTAECRDLRLTQTAISGQINMLFREGMLIAYYTNADTDLPVLTLIDLEDGAVVTNLDLTGNFLAATLRGEELLLFGRDETYEVFLTGSQTFTSGGNTPDIPLLSPGLFQTRFSGEVLLLSLIYQQPSLFFSQPALYDLGGGNFSSGGTPFLPVLQERIELETGNRVLFGNFDADPSTGLVVITYVIGDGSPEGGVVLTDFSGKPLQIIPLPIVPERLVIREIIQRGR